MFSKHKHSKDPHHHKDEVALPKKHHGEPSVNNFSSQPNNLSR